MSRLFFSLWPDEPVREQIAARTDEMNLNEGRRLRSGNYHMTLAFLGEISDDLEEQLIEHAKTLSFPVCDMTLDRSGWWPKPKIAWLAPSQWPVPLSELADNLKSAASDAGVGMIERPWRPHVTVARKIKQAREESQIEPIHWQISSFCLVESITGNIAPEYQVKASWPLKIM